MIISALNIKVYHIAVSVISLVLDVWVAVSRIPVWDAIQDIGYLMVCALQNHGD